MTDEQLVLLAGLVVGAPIGLMIAFRILNPAIDKTQDNIERKHGCLGGCLFEIILAALILVAAYLAHESWGWLNLEKFLK